MNAEVRNIKTNAELALAQAYSAAKAKLPGDRKVVALREAAFRRFDALGLPHRRVEEWKYTDLRALMREAKPIAGAARRRRQGARQGCRQAHRRHGCAAHRVRRRHVRAGTVGPRRSVARPDHPLDGAGAGGGRSAGRRQSRQGRAGRARGRGRAQHRADARRRRHSRRQGRDRRAADPSGVCRDRATSRPRCSPARWS